MVVKPSEAQEFCKPDELLARAKFDAQGLLPCITQDAETGAVLMLAWMTRESLEMTLKEGRMVYWSRSRNELWRKGDTSGHTQTLVSLHLDCDDDALLAKITQAGAACHTGRFSCFFVKIVS